MATVDYTTGAKTQSVSAHRDFVGTPEAYIDFSKNPASSGDVLLLLAVPNQTYNMGVFLEVEEACDASVTLAAGDFNYDSLAAIGATAWLAAKAGDAVATFYSGGIGSAETNALGKFYEGAAKLGVTIGGADATTGKIRLRAVQFGGGHRVAGTGGS